MTDIISINLNNGSCVIARAIADGMPSLITCSGSTSLTKAYDDKCYVEFSLCNPNKHSTVEQVQAILHLMHQSISNINNLSFINPQPIIINNFATKNSQCIISEAKQEGMTSNDNNMCNSIVAQGTMPLTLENGKNFQFRYKACSEDHSEETKEKAAIYLLAGILEPNEFN